MATTITKYVDGTWGTAFQGATALCANKWDFTGTSKNNDTPTSCVPGFNAVSPGQRSGQGNMTVFFDGTNLPNFVEGSFLTNITLGSQGAAPGTNVVQVSMASAIIDSVKITNPNPGTVTYDIAFQTNGTYQYGALPTS